MKLCNICLKTFRDNYALKRHQASKACKDISNDTHKTIILNKDYTYNNGNKDNHQNIYNVKNNKKNMKDDINIKKIIINKTHTIDNNNENQNDNKQIIITSKKVKGDEKIIKNKSKGETYILQKKQLLTIEKYDFTLEPKIIKKGDIFNCSLCQTEFKYRNNFYRHKKKCPIILKSYSN
jgi:hypothetical protein